MLGRCSSAPDGRRVQDRTQGAALARVEPWRRELLARRKARERSVWLDEEEGQLR